MSDREEMLHIDSEMTTILDKIWQEIYVEMLSHNGTGEVVIQAYADGLKKGLKIIDNYRQKVRNK